MLIITLFHFISQFYTLSLPHDGNISISHRPWFISKISVWTKMMKLDGLHSIWCLNITSHFTACRMSKQNQNAVEVFLNTFSCWLNSILKMQIVLDNKLIYIGFYVVINLWKLLLVKVIWILPLLSYASTRLAKLYRFYSFYYWYMNYCPRQKVVKAEEPLFWISCFSLHLSTPRVYTYTMFSRN